MAGEIWNRRKDGEVYPEWLNINVIRDDEGSVSHYAGVFQISVHTTIPVSVSIIWRIMML